jgi:hypothetical protein
MSPLQKFLVQNCDADPTAALPLVALFNGYQRSLDGTEAPQWRDGQYVRDVLARSFKIRRGYCKIREVVGLRLKYVGAAAVQSEAAPCLN